MSRKKNNKKKSKSILLIPILFILLCIFSLFYEPSNKEVITINEVSNIEIPNGYNDEIVINHNGYSLSYSEKDEQAYWVAYQLTRNELYGDIDRSDDFREDPSIPTGSAELSDYKKSGYDRGHLCSSADQRESEEAQSDSFYMSNMSPQTPGFNRGIWKETEETVRNFADTEGKVYVVTGPILTDGPYKTIGNNEVTVPNYYYKAVLKYAGEESKAIGFLQKNEKLSGDPIDYVVPIDKIEELSKIDFFPKLPDKIEDQIEANIDVAKWDFDKFSVSKGLGPSEEQEEYIIQNEQNSFDQLMSSLKELTISFLQQIKVI